MARLFTGTSQRGLMICLMVVCAWSSVAQKQDSIKLMNEVFAVALAENPQKSIAIAEEMLRLAREAGDTEAEGEALYNSGQAFYFMGRYTQAFDFYRHAQQILTPTKNQKILGKVYNALGNCFVEVEDYASALHNYSRALSLSDNRAERVKTYNNIGSVNIFLARYDSAEFYFKKTLQLSESDPKQKVVYLHNIAYIRYETGNYSDAIDLYRQSIAHTEALKEDRYLPRFYKNLADCYLRYGYTDSSKVYLDRSLRLSVESKRYAQEADVLLSYSAYFDTLRQLDNAIKMARQAQVAAARTSAYNHGKIYEQLSHLYHKAGDPAKALQFQKQHTRYLDSVRLVHQETAIAASSEHELTPSSDQGSNVLLFIIPGVVVFAGGILFLIKRKSKTAATSSDVPEEVLAEGKYIKAQHQGGETLLSLRDIIWFEKADRAYYACTEKEKYRIKPTITELEASLPPTFVRVNRAVIINLHFLHNYSSWENNKYVIRMKQPAGTEFISTRDRIRKIEAQKEV